MQHPELRTISFSLLKNKNKSRMSLRQAIGSDEAHELGKLAGFVAGLELEDVQARLVVPIL